MDGQAQDLPRNAVGVREAVDGRAGKAAIHRELADQRVEVASCLDVGFGKARVDRVAAERKHRLVDHDHAIGVVPVDVGTGAVQPQARDAGEAVLVALVDALPHRQRLVDVLELEQAEGGLDFVHLAVDARRDDGDLVGEAEVLQVVDALLDLGVGADDRTAFEGVEDLGGVEAEYRQIAVTQHGHAVALHAEGMGGVVDDLEPVGVGDALDAVGVARDAVAMDRQDGGGGRGDRFLDAVGVEVAGHRVDIDEHRSDAVPQQRVGGGHERVRGRDHLAADAQRLQRGHQGQGAVGEQAEVLDAEIARQFRFELLVEGAVVGQPAAGPDLFEIGDELVEWRQMWLGNKEGRGQVFQGTHLMLVSWPLNRQQL